MSRLLLVLTIGLLALPASAQVLPSAYEPMWIANRNSSDISKISLAGEVLATVNIGTNLRRLKVAPDGKIWVIKFIQATFDIRNPDGTLFLTVTSPVGSPYDVAFDRNGHAWLTGAGSTVQEFTANGIPTNSGPAGGTAPYQLAAGSALGITVDADGNKWIAHRTGPPGSVSRIDAITGVVTNHPAPPGSNIMPVAIVADFRGVGNSSHVWVVGDSGTTLDQYDNLGAPVSATVVGTSLTPLTTDLAGNVWCGSFGNGNIYKVTPSNPPTVASTYSSPPSCLGLEFDSFGRLWTTARMATGVPCEVRRLGQTTGQLEVFAAIGLGTQSALSSRYHHALVVDQLGDADGDGVINISEVVTGTSPFDPQSNGFTSLSTTGSTALGAAPVLSLATNVANTTFLAAATAIYPPGLQFPGVTGTLYLDVTALLQDPFVGGPLILTVFGPFAVSIPLPTTPGSAGLVVHFQGLTFDPTQTQLTNVASIKLF